MTKSGSSPISLKPRDVLGKDGPLSKQFKNYSPRENQIKLAEIMQLACENEKHLIAEAPTGIGKSYAAILTAIKAAGDTGKPVVISTHTISLQQQLVEKDIPFILDSLGIRLQYALAKGRSNYISLRRFELAKEDDYFTQLETYKNFSSWVKNTKDGSKSSLRNPVKDFVWNKVKSDSNLCQGEKCPFFDNCHYQNSRRDLAESQIIVANHSLVLLDRKMKHMGLKGVLPDYDVLIFDEAHEVETVARNIFTFELTQNGLAQILGEVWSEKGNAYINREANGLLSDNDPAKECDKNIRTLMQENKNFFDEVSRFLDGKFQKRLTKGGVFEKDILSSISEVLKSFKKLTSTADGNQKTSLDYVAVSFTEIALELEKLIDLKKIEGKSFSDIVAWASKRFFNKQEIVSVVHAPIFLKSVFSKTVLEPIKSVIFISATLTSSGKDPFSLFKSSVGLPKDTLQCQLSPTFNYQKQCNLILVTDMPSQKSNNYITSLTEQVKKYVKLSKGGAFVLFTSFKDMRAVKEKTEKYFELLGYPLFVQGDRLTRPRMVEEFKKSKHSVLFGVSSFWTGVDIPGQALRNVIIAKLPFPSPGDPLLEAQQEIYSDFNRNFFSERAIPMTSVLLKQGFGRLIRTATDRGIVVILDSRIVTAKYGSRILKALPSCPIMRVKRDQNPLN